VNTVDHGINVLKGLFSSDPLDIHQEGKFDQYVEAQRHGDVKVLEESWKNIVGRTWNTLFSPSSQAREEEQRIETAALTGQLRSLDAIFETHFGKNTRYFMTSATSWTSVLPTYVRALKKFADDLAQQPGRGTAIGKIYEMLPAKIKWVTMDHGRLHVPPPFPLMTQRTVGVIAESLKDIKLALYEVSWFL
jgi:hypothetical protein